MTVSQIMEVIQAAMVVTVKVAAPILVVSMLVGLVISIFQAATQIHEQTITFVPKLLTVAVIMVAMGGWMIETMGDFTKYIFNLIASLN